MLRVQEIIVLPVQEIIALRVQEVIVLRVQEIIVLRVQNHSVEGTHLDAFNHCHNMCFLVAKQFLSRAIIGPITF